MRLSMRMGVGATLVSLTASLLAVASPASAAATSTPPWEPDGNAVGTLSFYNASGAQITGGTNLNHLFDYALGSTDAARSGTTKATVFFGYPDHTKADTTQWISEGASAASVFPDANAPGSLNNTGRRPLSHPASSDVNLTAKLGGATLDDTDGYKGIVQIRVKDSGPGIGNGFQSKFWASDISYDQAAGTWTQVYPAAPVVTQPKSTTTTLATNPTSPQTTGTAVTLTATVSPTADGTVQFFDGTTAINTPAAVTGGTATTTTSSLIAGSHSLTATFTPTDTAAFTGSTSAATTYVINAPAAETTTTTLAVTPTSPQQVGSDVGLTATVTPTASGTVQFLDGATKIGSPVTVADGKATTSTSTLTVGSHDLSAAFTPADSTKFSASTSGTTTYVITAKPATATTTTLTVTPSSPQNFGTPVTLTATVAPDTAVGSVQFYDGTTTLGSPVAVSNGTATTTTSALKAGSHDLSATFVPADSTIYATSTSAVSTFVVTGAVPDAPTAVTASAGNASATVTWKAPSADGGSNITGYDVQYSSDGGANYLSASVAFRTSTATTQTVTGLTNGTSYLFRVAAINAIGTGAYSAPSAAVTPSAASAVSIAPATSSVKYNTVVAVSTVVTDAVTKAPLAGETVQLYRRPNSTTPVALIATLTTDSKGAARFLVRVTANGQFQYRFAGTAAYRAAYSPTISVSATQVITVARTASTIRSGSVVGFYGEVTPAVSGQTIVLQQRSSSGAYTTKATATIQRQTLPNGKTTVGYKILVRLTGRGTYTFRVYKPATATLAAGYTSPFGVKVT